MKTTTREYKGYYGNVKETQIEFEDKTLPEGQTRLLEITTMKRSSGDIVTNASGYILSGSSKTCVLFQDFSREYARSGKRATKGNIATLHDSVDVESVVKDFKEFYELGE